MVTHPIAFGFATFIILAIIGASHPDARWPESLGRLWLMVVASLAVTVAFWPPL